MQITIKKLHKLGKMKANAGSKPDQAHIDRRLMQKKHILFTFHHVALTVQLLKVSAIKND